MQFLIAGGWRQSFISFSRRDGARKK